MVGTDCFLFIRDYPTVQPAPPSACNWIEKIRRETEPKEKIDFESTVAPAWPP
jgi:hypothetical protein